MLSWNWSCSFRLLAVIGLCTVPLATSATGTSATAHAGHGTPATSDAALTLSADQARLHDAREHLWWPRCVAGTDWSEGHCSGRPLRLDQAEAGIFAREYARVSGRHYRLPTVPELKRLSGLLQASPHQADWGAPLLAAGEWVWTSSPVLPGPPVNPYRYDNVMEARIAAAQPPVAPELPRGWAANLRSGSARDKLPRDIRLPVILVLSGSD